MTIDKAHFREQCWEQLTLDKERDLEQIKGNFKGAYPAGQ